MLQATLLAGCVVLAMGCGTAMPTGQAGSPTGGQAASPAPHTPASASAVTSPPKGPKPVKPTGDAVNVRKVPWQKAKPVAKGRAVQLVWSSGVEPCTVLDRVKVKETGKTVTITLYEGASPKARNVACIMIAIEKTTTVKLKTPLGHRKIVDGAKR
ncbi:hypothetical protein GCM10010149_43020 [Nonomuraea roseoviolacea subsp. roseoviolacea]|uniref:DUF1573 domain-containing protein n=2 Tax=Nonomuraea TaxID=83681 RepID=A0ABT1JYQ3_9ACTN|nr:hypothetical protein [Nonomuraea roseoviolacea]MCP2346850.1 hypothetical protein [Nonomuraea roseoviolacea subsp. carminata]